MSEPADGFTCPECNGAGEWDEGPKWGGHAYAEPVYDQVICPVCGGSGKLSARDYVQAFGGSDEDPVYREALEAVRRDEARKALERARAEPHSEIVDKVPF